jgi:glycosyltransferase involved in cell wall biosynthesis
MRVGVNLLFCIPGAVGGSEQYLTRQLVSLSSRPVELTAYVPQRFRIAHPELAHVDFVEAPSRSHRRAERVVVESTWLPRRVRDSRVDVVHHGGGTVPARQLPHPEVVTIHDVQYRTFPDTFSPLKLRWLRRQVPAAIERAAVVTVPSEYVKHSLMAMGASSERVVVVPHPLPLFDRSRIVTPADELRARYQLRRHVVTYPAITYRHKNHDVLVRALGLLHRNDISLVLIGGEGPAEADLRGSVTRLGLDDRVVRPGRVSDADRDGLLAMSACLAFPSRYEGFGAPLIEAFGRGTPVISSGVTALAEVGGDAVLTADPLDAGAWADAIERLVDDPDVGSALVARAVRRLDDYTADRCADALIGAYHRAMS